MQTATASPEITPRIIPPDDIFSDHLAVENKGTTPENLMEEGDVANDIPPSFHRYPICSHDCNTQEIVLSSPLPQANVVIDKITGNVLEY